MNMACLSVPPFCIFLHSSLPLSAGAYSCIPLNPRFPVIALCLISRNLLPASSRQVLPCPFEPFAPYNYLQFCILAFTIIVGN